MKATQRASAEHSILVLLLLTPIAIVAQDWRMQPAPLTTRWAAAVDPSNAWPEYPRPQMARPRWQNLNGLWEYAITAKDAAEPQQYADHILVPYPVESALSGVKNALRPDQLLWYRRTIRVLPGKTGERVLLHFGAVDYEATVYMNDRKLGTHSGGYQSFTFEITDALTEGDNELVVRVYDPTDQGPNPQGKQNLNPQWMYYAASSGIWQTVWLEHVPSTYIEELSLTPDVDRSELQIEVSLNGKQEGHTVEAIARSGKTVVGHQIIRSSGALRIDQPRLWSPDDPHLYDLQLRVLKNGQAVDEVSSYFGLRKIALQKDDQGRARIHLNDRYTYNLGVVDQGYWPDGLYTAPTDAALKFDVQAIKALGFNTVRKHMKVEPQRWYYHCDRLGLMVWQDMPSSNNDSPQARAQFELEIQRNLAQLHNHPSITTWTLFNEGWGAYDQERLAQRMKQADPSRLLNGHSGPFDHVKVAQWERSLPPAKLLYALEMPSITLEDFLARQRDAPASWMTGDVVDMHDYPGPRMFPAQAQVASVTGEHGSFGVYVEGHVWNELKPVGAGLGGSNLTPKQLLQAHADSIQQLQALQEQGLSGSSYFEIVDVESEHQGFLTYDRALAKVPVAQIERLNTKLVPRARNYAAATAGFVIENADWTPESQRYAGLLAEFRSGRRDASFLRRLALMALRQKDQAAATEVSDAFIAQVPRPYSQDTWQTIVAITNTSQDRGFELLRTNLAEANASLGPHQAEKKIRDIIQRELIIPYFKETQRKQSWQDFESAVAAMYGELGREAVCGARMMDELAKEDWAAFGNSYVRYFETAAPRTPYPVHTLSYQVLAHVTDAKALETAIRVMRWRLDVPREHPVFGRYDPIELDTYASLLHKAGRTAEALRWQQQAVELSFGRDRQITENLQEMKAADEAKRARTGTVGSR